MLRPQRLLQDRQGPLIQRLDLGVPTLGLVEHRQVVEQRGGVRMVGAELALAKPERFLGEHKRRLVAALGAQLGSAVDSVQELGRLGMRRAGPQCQAQCTCE